MFRFERPRCAVTAIATLLALAGTAQASSANVVDEVWYVVKIAGSPVGFMSESERAEDGAVIYYSHTELNMSRMGTPLKMVMVMEEVSDADGAFRKARMDMDASFTGMTAAATVDGDSLDFRFETAGSVTEDRLAWQEGAVSLHAANEMARDWLVGTDEPELLFTTFRVSEGEFVDVRMVRKGTVTETIDGEAMELFEVDEFEGGDVPMSTSWHDADGRVVRSVIRQMGMEIVMERIDAADIETIELEPNFDIIRQSMIRLDRYPDPASDVQDLTVRLDMSRPVAADRDFSGPNQSEVDRGEDWVELLISRDTIVEDVTEDDKLPVFLEPDRFIQSDHDAIRAVADSVRDAVGSDDWKVAKAVSAWVGKHITGKNFEQGFASALEVYETRTGDCTEHSMLLTAVLRAAGIPARPVVGLAYSDGQLVGHMWAEAYVDHWRSLDALDQEMNPVRIRISSSDNGEAVDERELVRAYSIVGGMKVSVVGFNRRAN